MCMTPMLKQLFVPYTVGRKNNITAARLTLTQVTSFVERLKYLFSVTCLVSIVDPENELGIYSN